MVIVIICWLILSLLYYYYKLWRQIVRTCFGGRIFFWKNILRMLCFCLMFLIFAKASGPTYKFCCFFQWRGDKGWLQICRRFPPKPKVLNKFAVRPQFSAKIESWSKKLAAEGNLCCICDFFLMGAEFLKKSLWKSYKTKNVPKETLKIFKI